MIPGDPVNRPLEEDMEFLRFVEKNIEILLREERPFIVCSRADIPPLLIKKDEKDIWIAFLSEFSST